MAKTEHRKLHKGLAVLIAVLLFFLVVFGVFCLGVQYRIKIWKYWRPDYEKTDITGLLDKETRTEEDYAVLYAQTGLTAIGIEDTLAQENGKQTVLAIQKHYFEKIPIYGEYETPLMYQQRTDALSTLAHLQDGDVLVTASTVVSWWRWGHSALVLDGEGGILLESIGVGSKSKLNAVEVFTDLPSFILLRPKVDAETKAKVVKYAKSKLVGLPYSFAVGIFTKKAPKKIKSTQCAHLIWYAYKRFGIDLDSDGGRLVLPQDIANSKKVEIVQVFGFHPKRLWK